MIDRLYPAASLGGFPGLTHRLERLPIPHQRTTQCRQVRVILLFEGDDLEHRRAAIGDHNGFPLFLYQPEVLERVWFEL